MTTEGLRRSTALVAVGQAAVKGNQLLLALVLVRMLTPAAWNQLAFLLSIHLAVVTFGTLGLQHSLLYFMTHGDVAPRRLVLRTAAVTAAIGATIAVVLTALAGPIGSSLHVAPQLSRLSLAAMLELAAAGVPSAFIATERFGWAAAWDLSHAAVLVTLVVTAAAIGGGVAGVVHALVLAAAIRVVAMLAVVGLFSRDAPVNGQPASVGRQLAFAFPLGLTLAASVLNRSIDKWYIAAIRPAEVGRYAIAAQEIPLLAVVPYAGGAVVAARLATAFRDRQTALARSLWMEQTSAMTSFVVPATVAVMVVAPLLLPLAVADHSSALVISFECFTAITLHRVAEYGLVLRAAGRSQAVLTSALVLLVANAVLALVGAWWFGPIGAASGTLVANVVAWLAVLRQVGHALGTGVAGAFPWRVWIRTLSTSSLAAGVALVATRRTGPTVVMIGARLAVFAAVVGVAEWARRQRTTVRLDAGDPA
jgi:O-antigen/teichoic acid export membrane protein